MEGRLQVFSGNANRPLAAEIASHLNINLGRALVGRFKNGESRVKLEENVRGSDVFVIQPTCTPVNEHLMELLLLIDALRRASAARVTAVIPYYGYAKQEKKTTGREPISAKLVANLIRTAGAHRVLTMDLHAPAIEGFFDIPVDHLYAMPVFIEYLRSHGLIGDSAVAISPDAGGVERARGFAKRMESSMAIIDKRRPAPNISEVMNIIGDVRGKHAVIIDDMIDTAGTVSLAAKAVLDQGAKSVVACATHGVLSGPAIQRIEESVISEVIISDTIPLSAAAKQCKKIKVLSVARLLGESIRRIHHGDSISSLFI